MDLNAELKEWSQLSPIELIQTGGPSSSQQQEFLCLYFCKTSVKNSQMLSYMIDVHVPNQHKKYSKIIQFDHSDLPVGAEVSGSTPMSRTIFIFCECNLQEGYETLTQAFLKKSLYECSHALKDDPTQSRDHLSAIGLLRAVSLHLTLLVFLSQQSHPSETFSIQWTLNALRSWLQLTYETKETSKILNILTATTLTGSTEQSHTSPSRRSSFATLDFVASDSESSYSLNKFELLGFLLISIGHSLQFTPTAGAGAGSPSQIALPSLIKKWIFKFFQKEEQFFETIIPNFIQMLSKSFEVTRLTFDICSDSQSQSSECEEPPLNLRNQRLIEDVFVMQSVQNGFRFLWDLNYSSLESLVAQYSHSYSELHQPPNVTDPEQTAADDPLPQNDSDDDDGEEVNDDVDSLSSIILADNDGNCELDDVYGLLKLLSFLLRLGLTPQKRDYLLLYDTTESQAICLNLSLMRFFVGSYRNQLHLLYDTVAPPGLQVAPVREFNSSTNARYNPMFLTEVILLAPRLGALIALSATYHQNPHFLQTIVEGTIHRLQDSYRFLVYPECIPDFTFFEDLIPALLDHHNEDLLKTLLESIFIHATDEKIHFKGISVEMISRLLTILSSPSQATGNAYPQLPDISHLKYSQTITKIARQDYQYRHDKIPHLEPDQPHYGQSVVEVGHLFRYWSDRLEVIRASVQSLKDENGGAVDSLRLGELKTDYFGRLSAGWVIHRLPASYSKLTKRKSQLLYLALDHPTRRLFSSLQPVNHPDNGTHRPYISLSLIDLPKQKLRLPHFRTPLQSNVWFGIQLTLTSGLHLEVYLPGQELRNAWFSLLHANLYGSIPNTTSHLTPSTNQIIVEEWYQIENKKLLWGACSEHVFFDRFCDPLPTPSPHPLQHWQWLEDIPTSVKSKTHAPYTFLRNTMLPVAQIRFIQSCLGDSVALEIPNENCAEGWLYSKSFHGPYDTNKHYDKGEAFNYRRRKWIRVREFLPRTDLDLDYPVHNPHEVGTRGLVTPLSSHRDTQSQIALEIAQGEVLSLLRAKSPSFLPFSLLIHLMNYHPLDHDLLRILTDTAKEVIASRQLNFQHILQILISCDSQTFLRSSPALRSAFLAIYWTLLTSELNNSFSYRSDWGHPSSLLSCESLFRGVRDERLTAGVFFWSTFVHWFYGQSWRQSWVLPSWKEIQETISANHSNRSELIFSDSDLTEQLRETFQFLKVKNIYAMPVSVDPTAPAPAPGALDPMNPTFRNDQLWWHAMDGAASLSCSEFIFEAACLISGLHSLEELLAFQSSELSDIFFKIWTLFGVKVTTRLHPRDLNDTDALSFRSIERTCSMSELIEADKGWYQEMLLLMTRLDRIFRVFFPTDQTLCAKSWKLLQEFSSTSLRTIRKQFYSLPLLSNEEQSVEGLRDHLLSFPSGDIQLFPNEIFISLHWLSIFHDWRYSYTVVITGVDGSFAELINGTYSFTYPQLHFVKNNNKDVVLAHRPVDNQWCVMHRGEGQQRVLLHISAVELDVHGNEANQWIASILRHDVAVEVSQPSVRVQSSIDGEGNSPDAPLDISIIFLQLWNEIFTNQREYGELSSVQKLNIVRSRWLETYYFPFEEEKLTYRYLEDLSLLLSRNPSNIALFLRVISHPVTNQIVRSPQEQNRWIERNFSIFQTFLLFSNIHHNVDQAISRDQTSQFSDFLDSFLTLDASQERMVLWSMLRDIHILFHDNSVLLNLQESYPIPQVYHSLLLEIPSQLWILLLEGREILDWMRVSSVLRSDSKFRVQLDEIQSKGVSALPEQIPSEDAKEHAVRAVTSIKNFFQKLIFAPSKYFSFKDFMDCLLSLSRGAGAGGAGSGGNAERYEQLTQDLHHCLSIKDGIIELFEESDEFIIPNKLLSYSHPLRHATWYITSETLYFTSKSLKLTLPDGTATSSESYNVLNYEDLVDYQSKCNLISQRKKDTDLWIDAFNQQFKWICLMQILIKKLIESGHVEYNPSLPPRVIPPAALGLREAVYCSYPFSVVPTQPSSTSSVEGLGSSPETGAIPFPYHTLQDNYFALKEKYHYWVTYVNSLRTQYYFLNLFSIHQIWSLVEDIDKLSQISGLSGPQSSLRHLFKLYGYHIPERALIDSLPIWTEMKKRYLDTPSSSSSSSSLSTSSSSLYIEYFALDNPHRPSHMVYNMKILEVFGHWSSQFFHSTPQSFQSRELSRKFSSLVEDIFVPGMNIVEVPEGVDPLDILLTVYIRSGVFPEREQVVICSANSRNHESRLDEILSLIYRWGTASENLRTGCVYTLVGIEFISSEYQRKIASKIETFLSEFEASGHSSQAPRLVVIMESQKRQNQYLFQAFSTFRREYFPLLSDGELQQILADFSNEFGNQLQTYASENPGHGKSAHIIAEAKQYFSEINTAPRRSSSSKASEDPSSHIFYFPLHYETLKPDIIDHMETLVAPPSLSSPLLLHLAVGSVRNSIVMSQILFELIFFGGLVNYETGKSFCWKINPKSKIFIELANCPMLTALAPRGQEKETRPRTYSSIRLLQLFPTKLCTLTAQSFRSTLKELDAISLNSSAGDLKHQQLRAVSVALHLLSTSSTFPGNFWSVLPKQPALSKAAICSTLAEHFKIQEHDSGHRIWALISILYFQLQSVFHKDSFLTNTYMIFPGDFVKNVIRFLIMTALDICQAAQKSDTIQGKVNVIPWRDLNHEFLCTQSAGVAGGSGGGFSFLCLDSTKSNLAKDQFKNFREILTGNEIKIDTTEYAQHFVGALNSIIGTSRTQAEADQLLGGYNCITKDSIMKMIALFIRLQCHLPVVLMGECGCGKTQLIEYTCAYWGVELKKWDCHGGTTVADIEAVFNEVESSLAISRATNQKYFVFLDEINTCVHIDLITEIIINHTLNGRKLHPNIVILGALNPHRLRTIQQPTVSGLEYRGPTGSVASSVAINPPVSNTLDKNLVYKVHPIPDTLLSYIYDFGALESSVEALYIRSMITRGLEHRPQQTRGNRQGQGEAQTQAQERMNLTEQEKDLFTQLLLFAQEYIREIEGEVSSTSLRDVKRCIQLVKWFESIAHLIPASLLRSDLRSVWTYTCSLRSYVLAIALVYHYRINQRAQRMTLWTNLSRIMVDFFGNRIRRNQRDLFHVKHLLGLLNYEESFYCHQLVIEDNIAKNEALSENLFVTITCICNRIPVLLVGKPGSSKTLTLSIIENNLRGATSPNQFWSNFPAVTILSYQCSPLSRATGILNQYRKACAYQLHPNVDPAQFVYILLLDEIGLAEHSADMPLKILHQILPEEIISVIGISNWVLDPAKMNRAILISRPDPTASDLEQTGKIITENSMDLTQNDSVQLKKTILKCLANAFHEIYQQQDSSHVFFGLRDYYSLLKELRRANAKAITWDILLLAICRNFGGKLELLEKVLNSFLTQYSANRSFIRQYLGPSLVANPLSPYQMICENVKDHSCRHLMMIIPLGVSPVFLLNSHLFSPSDVTILFGSEFPDDLNDYSLVTSINKVKECMITGKTLMLIKHENIYESLYDVFNLRTVKKEQYGREVNMLRLAIGANSHLCPVHSKFKVILVVNEREAYETLDVPLLSRFEKQYLSSTIYTNLFPGHSVVYRLINQWIQNVARETGLAVSDFIPGYHPNLIASYLLYISDHNDSFWPHRFRQSNASQVLSIGDIIPYLTGLVQVMTPLAVSKSMELNQIDPTYLQNHECLSALINYHLQRQSPSTTTTSSPPAQLSSSSINDVITLTVIRTWNQPAALNSCYDQLQSELSQGNNTLPEGEPSRDLYLHPLINLPSCKSERELLDTLAKIFFNKSLLTPSILLIQCDLSLNSSEMISHVQYLCEELRRKRATWKIDALTIDDRSHFLNYFQPSDLKLLIPVIPLHIFIVQHDSMRRSFNPLIFQPTWSYYFCDDLRSRSQLGYQTLPLLTYSTYEVAKMNIQNLESIILTRYRDSLIRIRLPQLSTSTSTASRYNLSHLMRLIEHHLLHNPLFRHLCLHGILSVIKARPHDINHQQYLVQNIQGSLRQSLEFAFTEEIIFAFSIFLLFVNRNMNLLFLDPTHPQAQQREQLWFAHVYDSHAHIGASSDHASSAEPTLSSSFLNEVSKFAVTCPINPDRTLLFLNDGGSNFFICRIPFSIRMIRYFTASDIISTVTVTAKECAPGEILQTQSKYILSLIQLTFGDSLASFAGPGTGSGLSYDPLDYLYDLIDVSYVSSLDISVTSLIPSIDLYDIFRGVLTSYNSLCLQTVAAMYPIYWKCFDQIKLLVEMVTALRRFIAEEVQDSLSQRRLMDLYEQFFGIIRAHLFSSSSSSSSAMSLVIIKEIFLKLSGSLVEMYRSWFSSVSLLSLLFPYLQDLLQLVLEDAKPISSSQPSAQSLEDMKFQLDVLKLILLLLQDSSSIPISVLRKTFTISFQKPFCQKHNLLLWSHTLVNSLLKSGDSSLSNIENIATFYESLVRQLFTDLIFPSLRETAAVGAVAPSDVELLDLCVDIISGKENLLESTGGNRFQQVRCYSLRRAIVQQLFSHVSFMKHFEGNIIKEIEEGKEFEECSICLDPMVDPVITSCFHIFCSKCISDVKALNGPCPQCRAALVITGPCRGEVSTLGSALQLMIQWHQDIAPMEEDNLKDSQSLGERIHYLLHNPLIDSLKKYGVSDVCDLIARIQRELHSYSESLGSYLSTCVALPTERADMKRTSTSRLPGESSLGLGTGMIIPPVSYLSPTTHWANMFTLRCLHQKFGSSIFSTIVRQPVSQSPLYWLPATMRRELEECFQTSSVPKLNPFFMVPSYLQAYVAMTALDQRQQREKINRRYSSLCQTDRTPFLSQSRSALLLFCGRQSIEIYAHTRQLTSDSPPAALSDLYQSLRKQQGGIRNALSGVEPFWNRLPESANASASDRNVIRAYEEQLYTFLLSPQIHSLRWFGQLSPQATSLNIMKLETVLHVLSMAMRHPPQGWLYRLLTQPSSLQDLYLPSMPEDELLMVIRTLETSGIGKSELYQCECGAPYFIGDCGRPWVVRKCANCGRDIGGQSHNLVNTSKKVSPEELATMSKKQKGYLQDTCRSESCQIGREMTPFMCRFFRFLIHSCLTISSTLVLSLLGQSSSSSTPTKEFVNSLLQSLSLLLKIPAASATNGPMAQATAIQRWCEDRLMEDWNILRNCVNISDEDLSLLLHHLLSQADPIFSATADQFRDILFRLQWEQQAFQSVLQPTLQSLNGSGMIASLRSRTLEVQQKNEKGMILQPHETPFYALLTEAENPPSPPADGIEEKTDRGHDASAVLDPQSIESSLWGYRKRITINDFKQQFALNSINTELYPFIHTILQNERSLTSVSILIPIFQWHQYLFSLFPPRALSRETAATITNMEAVRMATNEDQRQQAKALLDAFIEAFNSSFCEVEFLFECRVNPYRHSLKMTHETPIEFSIPCLPPPGGEASIGVCTIALIEMLRGRQNDLLALLSNQNIALQSTAAVPSSGETDLFPTMTISQATPSTILSRILCSYDPSRDLLPLLFGYSLHTSDSSRAVLYDYSRINSALGKMLGVGKQRLALHLTLYEYDGDLNHSGMLTTLNRIIPQRELPLGVEEMIRGELSRHASLPELLKLMETALRFLTSPSIASQETNSFSEEKTPGGPSASPSASASGGALSSFECLSLDDFFLSTLNLSPLLWEETSVPILRNKYLTLTHLLHINSLLQQALGIDPFEKLDSKYRKALSSSDLLALQHLFPPPTQSMSGGRVSRKEDLIDLSTFLKALRVMILENLVDNLSLVGKSSLKNDFLLYSDSFLELPGFVEHFPEEIRLECAWEVCQYGTKVQEERKK